MTFRGFFTADGRTVEHGQFGGFPPAGDLEAERQLADVLVGDLFDVRLDELRAVHEATLPVSLER
jgi:hypothetical protein